MDDLDPLSVDNFRKNNLSASWTWAGAEGSLDADVISGVIGILFTLKVYFLFIFFLPQ